VQAAAHPALGVCLDSFHILAQRHDPAEIRWIPAEKIFYAQLAGAPMMTLDLLTWSRHHRCLPGHGDLDVTSFAAILADAGYRGPWSLEVFSDQLRAARPAVAAAECRRSLAELEEALRGRISPALAQLRGAGARRHGRRIAVGAHVFLAVLRFMRPELTPHYIDAIIEWTVGPGGAWLYCWESGGESHHVPQRDPRRSSAALPRRQRRCR
jgi:hypothetical protein